MNPAPQILSISTERLHPSDFSISVYGQLESDSDDLVDTIQTEGVLVPLVVTPREMGEGWEVISGNRRLACARRIGLREVPCEIRLFEGVEQKNRAILDYNRQRRKKFSQLMREADVLEDFERPAAIVRRDANLRQNQLSPIDRRNSDNRHNRTDETIARSIGIGGKDLYRQARSIWRTAQQGDIRASSGVALLDLGEKTIHAAYKDLRRRDRFTSGFRPTPYDVWSFKHDRAFGIPHPGSIPPGIIANALHYFTESASLVVDPMAGGGTTIDICLAMGRRCLAYDLDPIRADIKSHDIRNGFPDETRDCDLIFVDPPYHTMLAHQYAADGVALTPLSEWVEFLNSFVRMAYTTLRPGGHLALLMANQTEKDLPAGHGYLDHAFFGYQAFLAAGFLPQRRISCPMAGAYLPQHVQRARQDGRMLGQVRDLLVGRKPLTELG